MNDSMDKLLCWVLPVGNGGILMVSYVQSIDFALKVGQVLLIFTTIAFTGFQIWRMYRKAQKEMRLAAWVKSGVALCDRSAEGRCPLAEKLEQLEREN